jgi:hypothetical protein
MRVIPGRQLRLEKLLALQATLIEGNQPYREVVRLG